MAIIKSEAGHEVRYFPLGPFKVRLPILHYRFEVVDFILGCFLCVCCLAGITLNQAANPDYVTYQMAWNLVKFNGILYLLQITLGDVVVPGWVTPSIALTTAYLAQFSAGVERMQALCAVEILVAVFYVFMGSTGLAAKLVGVVPNCVKAGILLGAAISSCWGELKDGGRFNTYTISMAVCCLLAMFCLYSNTFQAWRKKNKFFDFIGKFGMVPAIIICIFVAPLCGEAAWPDFSSITLSNLVTLPDMKLLISTMSPFGIGFPTASMFIKAIPQALVIYMIGFGDFVTCQSLTAEAVEERAKDGPEAMEYINFDANRCNLICGIRNLILALICPNICMAGPLGAPLEIAILNRYKEGKKAMESVISGMGSFRIGTAFGVAFSPIVVGLYPVLPPAAGLCMFIQAYAMMEVAFKQTKARKTDICIMGVMAVFLAQRGALWAIPAGLLMYFIICDKTKIRNDFLESMEEVRLEAENAKREDEYLKSMMTKS